MPWHRSVFHHRSEGLLISQDPQKEIHCQAPMNKGIQQFKKYTTKEI